jgi:hypothetical protein
LDALATTDCGGDVVSGKSLVMLIDACERFVAKVL